MKRTIGFLAGSLLLWMGAVADAQLTIAIAAVVQMDGIILTPGSAPGSPVNGQCWQQTGGSAGLYCQVGGSPVGPFGTGGGLTIGASTITGGTTTRVLFDNAGVLGEYTISGTGNVAMTTSPTFVTPALGTPASGVGTNLTGTAAGLTAGVATLANGLKSATTTVVVSAATAPTAGQVLTATSGTAADWETLSASATSITPGTTTIVGATSPCAIVNTTSTVMGCLAYGATGNSTLVQTTAGGLLNPAILPLATSSTVGGVTVDNITIAASGGVLSIRSTINAQIGTSYVVLSTDAGKLVTLNNASAIAVTLPQAGTAGFGAGFGVCLLNIGAGTATVTPTTSTFNLNASQALTTGTTMCPRSDGTNYYGSVGNNNGGSGSGTVSSGTIGQIGVYAATGTTISGQTVASGVILKGQGAAVPVASAITDNASNVSIAEAALTTPVALTDGATIATNAALSNVFTVTLAGNRTLSNPTNLVAGQFITWQITQDATGGRTLAFGANFAWMSGAAPLLNSAANAKTTLSCFVDTTSTLQCAGGAPITTVTTGSNCSSAVAPAVCGSASGGSIAVPTGTNPTLTVNTTAVTANSQILMNIDESLGTKLSVTCNTTLTTLTNPVVTARTAGTSFTVQIGATIAVNPACVSYLVVN